MARNHSEQDSEREPLLAYARAVINNQGVRKTFHDEANGLFRKLPQSAVEFLMEGNSLAVRTISLKRIVERYGKEAVYGTK